MLTDLSALEHLWGGLFSALLCMGWYGITSEGYILYFLRKPFDKHFDRVEEWKKEQYGYIREAKKFDLDKKHEFQDLQDKIDYEDNINRKYKVRYAEIDRTAKFQLAYQWLFKPVILCPKCFASVWGSGAFYALYGVQGVSIYPYIINALLASSIVAILIRFYDE